MRIKDLIAVALGRTKPSVLIKNARILNVFSGKIQHGNIALYGKRIAGIGDYQEGEEVIDLKGMLVVPGLIDAHLHIESSMLSPREFARAVTTRGTTTVIADPHEIANVLGLRGIEYMIKATEGIPLNVYIGFPSSVPSTEFETSGARLGVEDMIGFLEKYPTRIISLGEVMNFHGVLNADSDLIGKIELFRHKYKKIDGHSPGLSGRDLDAYIDAFIRSDHESLSVEEAEEKLSKGMQIFIREGSAAKDLEKLLKAVNTTNHMFFSFCTDDRNALDILEQGHVDYMVRRSIEMGTDPVMAIRMATINTARYFGLRSMGAIAPGYKADMLVLEDLETFSVKMVFKDSKVVAVDGKPVEDFKGTYSDIPAALGKINIIDFNAGDLKVRTKGKRRKVRVIKTKRDSLLTDQLLMKVDAEKDLVTSDSDRDICKIVIFDRHKASGFSVGFVQGLGFKRGAVATSIGHDAHNLCVVGYNDADMCLAARVIKNIGGGITVCMNGKVLSKIDLPIAGLMSNSDLFTVADQIRVTNDALRKLGCTNGNFLMQLSFIQLAVIPQLKITDRGLVNVSEQSFVNLFE